MGINHLSESARIVAAWPESNYLTLNAKNTKDIVFGTTNTIKIFQDMQITNITISNAGEQTEFVDEVLSICVILDSTLSWDPQATRVTKKGQ